jgi:DedD protein
MDIALKQRLVGAIVLIALAVIVLPMLLGGRPEGSIAERQTIEIPPQPPELDFETRRYPIGQTPPSPNGKTAQDTVRQLPAPAVTEPREQAPGPVATVELSPDRPPSLDVSPDAAPSPQTRPDSETENTPRSAPDTPQEQGGRYVVQVASFGSGNNASRLSARLNDLGHSVMLDSVKSDVGTLHRVRIGPYASEAEANEAIAVLKLQISDIKPRVMDLQPDKVAQVTTPSDPLVRWVVQVGSFSSASNAEQLVARLRLESLSAYKEEISSSGSIIFRVRVGPFLERDEAIRINQLVAERLSLDGVVMSAD